MRSFGLTAALFLGFTALVGCGSNSSSSSDLTPQTACNKIIEATCNWASKCAGQAALTAMGYTSVGDCVTKMQADTCSATNAACDSGQTFHSDKAQSCIDAVKGMACPSASSSTAGTPTVCDQVCQ